MVIFMIIFVHCVVILSYLPSSTDAVYQESVSVASGTRWRPEVRAATGGKGESGRLVHRLEGRQAIRN